MLVTVPIEVPPTGLHQLSGIPAKMTCLSRVWGGTRQRFLEATQGSDNDSVDPSRRLARASSRTITERDSPDSHDERFERVRRAMHSRAQRRVHDVTRESANVHRRFGSEVDSSASGAEQHMSEAGIESVEEDPPEEIVVEVEPFRNDKRSSIDLIYS